MKKSILSLIAGAIVALASCSQTDEMPGQPQEGEQLATFTIQTPAVTRADVAGLSRYIVEVYEGTTATGTFAERVEDSAGTLIVHLKKNTDYTFLFWADKGTAKDESAGRASSGYWNTDDLKAVTVTSSKKSDKGEAAYCLVKTFNSKDFTANGTVVLKNATAQVNFVESSGLLSTNNTLAVTYAAGATLNVGTGKVTEVSGAITHTFTGIGQVSANTTLATDYILAPKGEQMVRDLTLKLNTEDPKSVTNVPFEQRFITNIKGEYSSLGQFTFTITADDTWETPDNEYSLYYPATAAEARTILGAEAEGATEPTASAHVFHISTAAQLRALRVLIADRAALDNVTNSDGYECATYKLTEDIDLGNAPWIPLDLGRGSFEGTFDGQGHTVSGLYVSGSRTYAGLFGTLEGTVRNLRVKGSVTNRDWLVYGIASNMFGGTIAFCSFEGTLSVTHGTNVSLGGICGAINSSAKVIACFANTVQTVGDSSATPRQGGIIGQVQGAATIKGCTWNYNSMAGTGLEKGYMGDNINETNIVDNAAFDGTNLAARIAVMNSVATDADAYRWEADGDSSVKLVPKLTN